MKKLARLVSLVLIFSLLLAVPAQATTEDTRGSIFFAAYGTDLYKNSATSFQIWFDVTANAARMDVLGTSEIVLYRSKDGSSWTKMRTYLMSDFTWMVDYNTTSHTDFVPYNDAIPGFYYRARVTFYAQDSRGIGERDVYTEILRM